MEEKEDRVLYLSTNLSEKKVVISIVALSVLILTHNDNQKDTSIQTDQFSLDSFVTTSCDNIPLSSQCRSVHITSSFKTQN